MGTVTTNLMTNAKNSVCVWLCSDRDKVARQQKMENFKNKKFIPLVQFTNYSFPVYLIKQKEGDLVIFPPHSMYQCFQRVYLWVIRGNTVEWSIFAY
jgi:hypothetical protein